MTDEKPTLRPFQQAFLDSLGRLAGHEGGALSRFGPTIDAELPGFHKGGIVTYPMKEEANARFGAYRMLHYPPSEGVVVRTPSPFRVAKARTDDMIQMLDDIRRADPSQFSVRITIRVEDHVSKVVKKMNSELEKMIADAVIRQTRAK